VRAFPWRYPILAAALVAVAFLAGDRRGGRQAAHARIPPSAQDSGPQSTLIETGSVEHRLRAMEAQLVELGNRIDRLAGDDGREIPHPH
jgi:hypothetical protein